MAIPISLHTTSNSPSLSNLLSHLPRAKCWEDYDIYQWEGSWYFPSHLEAAITFRLHFEARGDDVILASSPKTGTTWLKALVSGVMNRRSYCEENNHKDCVMVDDSEDNDKDPLTTNSPHALIQTFETQIYKGNPSADLYGIPSPRLFHTHMPYNVLPTSIKETQCKIVYITQNPNPKDAFVSLWPFVNAARTPEQGPFAVEHVFESFCTGIYLFGPYFDNVVGYWQEHLRNPHKILFLKYEDIKSDPRVQLKRLASFLGRPFLNDEDADKMLWKCSLESVKPRVFTVTLR